MPFDLQKLNTLVDDMVHEETHSWFCEAELLISSGMILQSMDVSLELR